MRPARRYAEFTDVPVEKSQRELADLIRRVGADKVIVVWDATDGAAVRFRLEGRFAQLAVPAPSEARMADLRRRSPTWDDERLREQEERRCWRALLLLVKAKLEAIATEITTVEREFMPDLLLLDGRRLEAWATPAIAEMYASGRPLALPESLGG